MDEDLFVVDRIDKYRSICVSTLARTTVIDSDAAHLGADRGYYVYEADGRPGSGGIIVLAKAASFEAAMRLVELWRQTRHMPPRKRRAAASA